MNESPVDTLECERLAGATVEVLIGRAQALLAALNATRLDDAAELTAATAEYAVLASTTRSAWRRFPAITDRGAHGGEPDPRAAQLFATHGYVRQLGYYTPDELASGHLPGAFIAREALRLRVYILLLRALIEEMAIGRLPATAYAAAVEDAGHRLAAMRIGSG